MAERTSNVPVQEGKAKTKSMPQQRSTQQPWLDIGSEMDRMFDLMLRGWPFSRATRHALGDGEKTLAMDVIDKEKEIVVRVEIPGIDEQDIDVQISDGTLKIRGEKREIHEENEPEGDYFVSELRYGSFQRAVSVPRDVDPNAASATYRNGTLTITLPRTKEALSRTRKIEVK